MKLPNADLAEIDLRKLADYCLSSTHPVGKHKATVFRSALGLSGDDVELLRGWLIEATRTGTAVAQGADEYGEYFRIDFRAVTEAGQAVLRSAWIIRTGEQHPRLITCYVLPE